MGGGENDRAELLRRFEAVTSGAELDDLRGLLGSVSQLAGPPTPRSKRPELRRPRLDEVVIYRIRVDLDQAKPPIWRRLDVRSDLTLEVVHQVLQSAFGWADTHLHRFAVGGHPFDRRSQVFLSPDDLEDRADADEGGVPATDVRLDEVLQEPGDVLRYLYDYGDSWAHTLRLEKVLPAPADAPTASCVDGRRATPPEDCGGLVTEDELVEVLPDPAHFDAAEVNEALQAPYFLLSEYGVRPELLELVSRLSLSALADDLAARMVQLVGRPSEPPEEEMRAALRAHQWFLDRAQGDGIELTSAGYLKPADVEEASLVVPAMGDWIGKNNRESHATPLLEFRESLQSMGLLRKRRGRLLLTRVGTAAQQDPVRLWRHLASRLVPDKPGTFESVASLFLLAYAGTSANGPLPLDDLATALTELGWRHLDGTPVDRYEVFDLDAFTVLSNVADEPADLDDRISTAAAALARAALRRSA